LNAGAAGTKQNDKLIFDNGADFASSAGYVKTLTYTNGGSYAGYYQGNITLTALPQTPLNGGPAANAPAPGSFIQVQLVSVEGPADGAFGFWEAGATTPTINLSSGQIGTNIWRLTESDGSPGSDPYAPVVGDDHFHEIEEDHPVQGQRYYRIKTITQSSLFFTRGRFARGKK
jgi:hypothetical protein